MFFMISEIYVSRTHIHTHTHTHTHTPLKAFISDIVGSHACTRARTHAHIYAHTHRGNTNPEFGIHID